MSRNKEPSVRQLRVGEELRHAMAEILGRGALRDPELSGRVFTVTEVRASPDLKRATVFVTPLGGQLDPNLLVALDRAASFLQKEVGQRIRLKFTPRLSFSFDDRFDYASKIDGLLRKPGVARDLQGNGSDNGAA
ncbi:MAG: Ribosome-binding factor A [Alphaproteobacteria bacterium MarineAlpha4_Bin2]|nr:MAG: Ribosome-binding factor A [Alphaproteobacteria bacterium MarineAlpha4_Bin2]